MFPALFGFQACSLLFVDVITKQLFKIQFKPKQERELKPFDSIVIYPANMGCTGESIRSRRVVWFNKIESAGYSDRVDNSSDS